MLLKTFQESLTAPRTEEKVRQLVALAAGVPLKDVGLTFSWKQVLDQQSQEEFNVCVAETLTTFFKVKTEPGDIEKLCFFWEIVNRITCKC